MLRPGTFALTALLAGLTAVGPLTTDMYLPSLPNIARQLNASTVQAQLTLSIYLVGFAVGQIFYGPLSDRHGRRRVLIGALSLYCAATVACALSTSIEMLIVSRAVQALGGSGSIVVARAIVRDLYSGQRAGRELSLIASVMALAPAVAPIIGGALQVSFGWRAAFVSLLGLGLAGMLTVWLLLPETLRTRTAEPISIGSFIGSYRVVGRSPVFWSFLGISIAAYAGLFAWISGASFVLQNLYGLSPFDFGVAFATGAVGYMCGSALSARLSTRIGLNGTIGVGGCFCTAGGFGMIASVGLGFTSGFSLVLPMAIFLAGLGMVLPHCIAGALTPFPERAGAASSLFGFLQQCAAAVCGAYVGWMLRANAWPLAITIAALGCLTLVNWALTRNIRRRAMAKAAELAPTE